MGARGNIRIAVVIEIPHGDHGPIRRSGNVMMRLECSISVPQQDTHLVLRIRVVVYDDKVHLSVLIPVHCGYANRRGAGGEIQVRTKSAIAIVDENGNSVGVGINRG